jgi:hypothetical protein
VDPLILLFGFVVGVLIGLTGVGGGSLMTPLLLLVGGYSPVVTIGTDLAYGAVTKTLGGWRHLRAGHVDVRLSWWQDERVHRWPGRLSARTVGVPASGCRSTLLVRRRRRHGAGCTATGPAR